MLFLLAVLIPVSVHAGIFSELFSDPSPSFAEAAAAETLDTANEIELLSATQNPDPQSDAVGEVVIDDNALVATGPVDKKLMAAVHKDNTGEISVYTVREGDSLSQVAEMFGVTANTILWANDLNKSTGIQPGQTLVILPVAGVRHVVKRGDTLGSIASKYEANADEILSFNQLETAAEISSGITLIIPGGEMHEAAPKKTTSSKKVNGKNPAGGSGGSGLVNPAPGARKTQGIHGFNGVDLGGAMGSAIRAAAAGTVIVAKGDGGWNGGYGNYIVIKHANGTQTLYAHLSSLSVGVGAVVDQGQTIGGMGNSGKSTGTHLHFEVRGGRNPF